MLFYESYYKAQVIAQKIIDGLLPINIAVIRQEILTTPGILHPNIITVISIAIGVLWLFAIVDCYRISRKLDS